MVFLLTLSVVLWGLVGCATLPEETQGKIILSETPKIDYQDVEFKSFDGVTKTSTSQKVEWFACKTKGSKASAVLMHDEDHAFSHRNFCASWQAQVFLANGFDVIGINRPGFGRSDGERDFVGPNSVEVLESGVARALTTSGVHKNIVASWGYSSGAMAASYFSKSRPSIKVLFLGAGLYDLEDVLTNTADKNLKKRLGTLKKLEGEDALVERSLIYDPSELAKVIYLYHGKADSVVLPSQSQKFHDLLLNNRHEVSLELIAGLGHNISWAHHRKVLEVLLHSSASKL